jgi:hypothetical protein
MNVHTLALATKNTFSLFSAQQSPDEVNNFVESRCAEPPAIVGPCRAAFRRWTYVAEEGRCRNFLYGGCRGNGNNFGSAAECESLCA